MSLQGTHTASLISLSGAAVESCGGAEGAGVLTGAAARGLGLPSELGAAVCRARLSKLIVAYPLAW